MRSLKSHSFEKGHQRATTLSNSTGLLHVSLLGSPQRPVTDHTASSCGTRLEFSIPLPKKYSISVFTRSLFQLTDFKSWQIFSAVVFRKAHAKSSILIPCSHLGMHVYQLPIEKYSWSSGWPSPFGRWQRCIWNTLLATILKIQLVFNSSCLIYYSIYSRHI